MVKIVFILGLLCQIASLQAREPYHATIKTNNSSGFVSAPNLLDLKRDLREKALEVLIPSYTPTSPASLNINLRGILAQGSFAANSTALVVQIPQAGITQTFTGSTRDESLALFKEFVRDGGHNHRLLKAYARFSPIDPIAGNPNSLQAEMAQQDYLLGHLFPLSGCPCSQPSCQDFQGGGNFIRGFSKGFDTTSILFPLRYFYAPKKNLNFIIDIPFTYNRNGGASSLFGSVGFGLQAALTRNWLLTATLRGGGGGSLDLCTAGIFVSPGLSSTYNYNLCHCVLSMTNYVGYFTSTNFWMTGVNFNYNLHNVIYKNGLSITSCQGLTFCNRPVNVSLFFVDSYFAREHLFIKHYDEIGASLIITDINPCLAYDCLSIGLSYQFGQKHYKGYTGNLTYQF